MSSQREPPGPLKQAVIQVYSGGAAGFVEVCCMHPLDLVKTRFQLQQRGKLDKHDPRVYTGIIDCFRKMYKHEGPFSYWKGILPPIIADTPKRALKFLTFEQYKRFFMFNSPVPTPLTFSCAGFCAGVTEALIMNPFEVVKVKMQANKSRLKEMPSTMAVTKQIYREAGIFHSRGLYKGLTSTIGRNGVFNLVYFGFYHSVKGKLPTYEDPVKEFFRRLTIGFCSGTLASCINIPFDVVKSRIQGPQPVEGQIKYRACFQSMALIYKEEGVLALYKGLFPKVLRLGPGGAIMMVVFEYVNKFLINTL